MNSQTRLHMWLELKPELCNSTVGGGGSRQACASSDTHNVISQFSSPAAVEVPQESSGPRSRWPAAVEQ